jgi:hypothetical protein
MTSAERWWRSAVPGRSTRFDDTSMGSTHQQDLSIKPAFIDRYYKNIDPIKLNSV